MKYLIVGLGNIGDQYTNTRHNIGFNVLDALAKASNIHFEDKRFGFIANLPYRGRKYILLKPSTYVNLSGKAVQYWMQKEKIPLDKLLVIADDISLPFGVLRLRKKGGDGGHNGLMNIIQVLGSQTWARLRFGVGNDFPSGAQVHYVLSKWTEEESEQLPERIKISGEIIKYFGFHGIDQTMNMFNNK